MIDQLYFLNVQDTLQKLTRTGRAGKKYGKGKLSAAQNKNKLKIVNF